MGNHREKLEIFDSYTKTQGYDALRRISHYYNLPDITYQTLLSKLYKYSKDESYS